MTAPVRQSAAQALSVLCAHLCACDRDASCRALLAPLLALLVRLAAGRYSPAAAAAASGTGSGSGSAFDWETSHGALLALQHVLLLQPVRTAALCVYVYVRAHLK